jgi:hypothetical protein
VATFIGPSGIPVGSPHRWVEIKSAAVEHDHGFEVVDVAISTGASRDGHDLTVQPFGDTIGEAL